MGNAYHYQNTFDGDMAEEFQSILSVHKKFDPNTLGAVTLWLDAQDSSTILHNNGAVSQWLDKSNNDNHAAQLAPNSQPTLNLINGHIALHGDGGNNFMIFPNLGLNGKTDVSVFIVFVVDPTTSGWDNPLCFGTSNEGRIETRGSGDTGELKSIAMGFDNNTTLGHGFNTAQLLSLTTNAADWSSWINGVPVVVENSSGGAWATGAGDYALLGSSNNARNLKGDIGEILIFERELNNEERLQIEAYLITKWGLTS